MIFVKGLVMGYRSTACVEGSCLVLVREGGHMSVISIHVLQVLLFKTSDLWPCKMGAGYFVLFYYTILSLHPPFNQGAMLKFSFLVLPTT